MSSPLSPVMARLSQHARLAPSSRRCRTPLMLVFPCLACVPCRRRLTSEQGRAGLAWTPRRTETCLLSVLATHMATHRLVSPRRLHTSLSLSHPHTPPSVKPTAPPSSARPLASLLTRRSCRWLVSADSACMLTCIPYRRPGTWAGTCKQC